MTIWTILNIEPTDDRKAIRQAYAAQLKSIDVAADPEAFEALRCAYEAALNPQHEEHETYDLGSLKPSTTHERVATQTAETPVAVANHPMDQINAMIGELVEGDSVRIFKRWVDDGVFADLDLSLRFQEFLISEFANHTDFPRPFFLHAYLKFHWEDLLVRRDDPLHEPLMELIEECDLYSLIEELEEDPEGVRAAILLDDKDRLETLIKAGADPKQRDKSGRTLLHLAVLWAGLCLVRWLISYTGVEDEIDALHQAIRDGDLPKVQLLIDSGYDINQPTPAKRDTPLQCAIRFHQIHIVDALLKAGANPRFPEEGRTPLAFAASRNSRAVRLLMEAGVHPSEANGEAINAALIRSHVGLARYLMEHLDISIREQWIRYIASCSDAAFRGFPSLGDEAYVRFGLGYMLPLFDIATAPALIQAADRGDLAEVRALLNKGQDVNQASDPHQVTALYSACNGGHAELVSELLAAGANPNVVIHNGLSPLHIAARYGYCDIMKTLIASGADVNLVGGIFQYSALFVAVMYGDREAIHILLDHGAEDKPTLQRHSALTPAVYNGDLETAKILVERGSDIHQVFRDKVFTLVYIAARYEQTEMLSYLLSLGLHPDWQPDISMGYNFDQLKGQRVPFTPLAAAIRNGDLESVELLLDAGADPKRQSNGFDLDEYASVSSLEIDYGKRRSTYEQIVDLIGF